MHQLIGAALLVAGAYLMPYYETDLLDWGARTMSATIALQSTITCPECGHRERETMPTDACQYFYDRKGCGAVLKPKSGDCCVFCSYGDVKCPPVQAGGCGC